MHQNTCQTVYVSYINNEIELIQNPKSFMAQLGSTIVSLLPTTIMVALFIMIFKMQGLGDKGKV